MTRKLVITAHEALAEAQAAGEFPRSYVTSVNGRVGAPVESVQPPGPIIYTARWWPEILTYGMAFAEQRSPVKSGHYRDSWFVMINGSKYDGSYSDIPLDAEAIITNDVPYARKIEVGHMKMSVPPGVVEDVVTALRRKFGELISVQRRFFALQRGYISHRGRTILYPGAVINMAF